MQILKAEIKEQIENAALEVFFEKGFEKASMQNIAARAQVSTSNIYNYFQSKEELFDAVVEPVYRQINRLLQGFMARETGHSFQDSGFSANFSRNVAIGIAGLIRQNRWQLLLICDQSLGTSYESCKEELIRFLEDHFREGYQVQTPDNGGVLIMHIAATNFVEGLLEITRHYQSDAWLEKAVADFVRYQIGGLVQFFA